MELIENLKISTDSALSFWATGSKRKSEISKISRIGHFKWKDQSHFVCKEINCKVIQLKNLDKIQVERAPHVMKTDA